MPDAPDAPDATTPATASRPARAGLDRFEHAVVRLNQGLIVALMASMAVLVLINVVTRYLFNHSIIWVEEFTQFEMIWVTFLGAGLALREGRHVSVDTLQDVLPDVPRLWLRRALAAAMVLFLAVLVVLGGQIVAYTWGQETPVMNLPTGAPYLAVPLGAAAMLLHLLLFWRRFIDRRFEHVEAPPADAGADPAEPMAEARA